MGRSVSIRRLNEVKRGPRGQPYAIVKPNQASDGKMVTKVGSKFFKPKGFGVLKHVEAMVGGCGVRRSARAKDGVEGVKQQRFGTHYGFEEIEDGRGGYWPMPR